MFAIISATLGFFSKLGIALGIAFAIWTVYYTSNHSPEIKSYNVASTYHDKGVVLAGIMDGRTDFVQHRQRDIFEYAAWYSAKPATQKATWLLIWCPLLGVTVSAFGLCILANVALKLIISVLTLGRC
jgi:hypothetical protein